MAMSERPAGRDRQRNSNRPRAPRRYGGPRRVVLEEKHHHEILKMQRHAEHRFDVRPYPMGIPEDLESPRTFHLRWEVHPVPLATEEKVASWVVQRGEYGWLTDKRVEEISQRVLQESMTLDQALSLRSALLQQKTVYSHHALKAQGPVLARKYKNGASVLELSVEHDFSPMNLFRTVLESLGWSKNKIKDSLRNPSSMKWRERQEFETAEAADRVASVDQSETQVKADLFEDILADWFISQGIRLRRQPEMVNEQYSELGRPVKTPDILFLDYVYINNQPVAWIDAKHFYGADVDFQRKKMKKQMGRYIEEWGSGAIMFRHGYCENLFLPGVLMLDSSPIDLSRLQADE